MWKPNDEKAFWEDKDNKETYEYLKVKYGGTYDQVRHYIRDYKRFKEAGVTQPTSSQQTDYTTNFERGNLSAGIMTIPQNYSPDQIKLLKKDWNSRNERSSRLLVLKKDQFERFYRLYESGTSISSVHSTDAKINEL